MKKNYAKRQSIIALANQGLHASEIARRTGLSRERVRQILLSEGVRAAARPRRLMNVPDEELFGEKLNTIATKYNVSISSVVYERKVRKRNSNPDTHVT